jgi:hypothetical protein
MYLGLADVLGSVKLPDDPLLGETDASLGELPEVNFGDVLIPLFPLQFHHHNRSRSIPRHLG